MDYFEDLIRSALIVAPVSAGLAYMGGHNAHQGIFTSPLWAHNLLFKARFARNFAVGFSSLFIYFSCYNYLTGVRDWPVTKYDDMQYVAPCMSAIPAAGALALLQRPRQNRLAFGILPKVGVVYLSVIGAALSMAFYQWQLSIGWDSWKYQNDGRCGKEFHRTLQNAPGSAIVRQLPFIPFHKEAKAFPETCISNPLYDAEFVSKAHAEAQQILNKY